MTTARRSADRETNGKMQNPPPKAAVNNTSTRTNNESALLNFINKTLAPLVLMLFVPNLVIALWYVTRHLDGSYLAFCKYLANQGIITGMLNIWAGVKLFSPLAMAIIAGYALFALILMNILPGKTAYGPVSPKGHTPVYKDNGFFCYAVTMITFAILTYALKQYGYSTSIVYDIFDEILVNLNGFSLVFCLVLYFKGRFWPSTQEFSSSGNFIFDYYWGTELYPRIFGFDVKVFTNCRFGMTVWPLLVLVYAVKSYELHGFVDSIFVSTFLQMFYFTKFFWWEAGYMSTIDIMLDRAGFYICWGCLVFVPGLYASVSLYLVNHPVHLGWMLTAGLLTLGSLSIVVNYLADWQKQIVRRNDGKCLVWGQKPEIIRATYRLESGEERNSLLLASGWWGLSRHFHYIPEIGLALCWTLPAGFDNIMPYSYWIVLVILLMHRSFRDEDKCSRKYGKFWVEYCKRVPYRVIPCLF
ncbi:uncharacterized protein LOC141908682 [Tubulanus polymorphus]|uniref:uncharacterized protein LOC141908682 n=1 Tax=Tubulanus polymorphus TaxID=672921 RepID=UPI003DA44297